MNICKWEGPDRKLFQAQGIGKQCVVGTYTVVSSPGDLVQSIIFSSTAVVGQSCKETNFNDPFIVHCITNK